MTDNPLTPIDRHNLAEVVGMLQQWPKVPFPLTHLRSVERLIEWYQKTSEKGADRTP